MNINESLELAKRCLAHFTQVYPASSEIIANVSLEVVAEADYLQRLIDIIKTYSPDEENPEMLIATHFSQTDGATLRTESGNYVVIMFKQDEPPMPIMIRTYHELAHIYSMHLQDKSALLPPDTELPGDKMPGFLFWKEFIADYLAYNMVHQRIDRFQFTDKETQEYLYSLLIDAGMSFMPGNIGSMSGLAGCFAQIMNMNGVNEDKGQIKLPFSKKTQAGRDLCRVLTKIICELRRHLKSDE
jgi:hypothetical protein